MGPDEPADPSQVLARLHRAMNDHDLEGFLANIHDDYASEQPAHPERAFAGRAQVQENWAAMFIDIKWTDVIAFLALVLVLMFRPSGLLGERLGRAA